MSWPLQLATAWTLLGVGRRDTQDRTLQVLPVHGAQWLPCSFQVPGHLLSEGLHGDRCSS